MSFNQMSSPITLFIDGNEVAAQEGEMLLPVALAHGRYIPHLCALEASNSLTSACRLCFVEAEGRQGPLSACTLPVSQGMVVNTQGAQALALARSGFELLIASHPIECGQCPRQGACELHRIARHLGVRLKSGRLRRIVHEAGRDDGNPAFRKDARKCVLCGRCVWVCRERLGKNILGFAYRSFDRVVTSFADDQEIEAKCRGCGECITVCPTAALTAKVP